MLSVYSEQGACAMPNQGESNKPASQPPKETLAKTPIKATPKQDEMGKEAKARSDNNESTTVKLEQDIRSGERWLIGVTAFGIIVNFFIGLIYLGQLKQMRKATQAATNASETGVKQLDSMRKDERPWIKVTTHSIVPAKPGGRVPVDKTAPINTPFEYINIGKLPAKNVDVEIFIEVVKNGEEPLLNKGNFLEGSTVGIIFPNDPQNTSPGRPYILAEGAWEDFAAGRSFLVVYGQATYKDVFSTSHWTNFCGYAAARTDIPFSARKCTDYNSTDDN
jgi:hypothetical protein